MNNIISSLGPLGSLIFNISIFVLVIWFSHWITKAYIIKILNNVLGFKNKKWTKVHSDNKTFHQVIWLVPILFFHLFISESNEYYSFLYKVIGVILVINCTLLIQKIFSSILTIYNIYPIAKSRPIKGYIQLINLMIIFFSGILIFCIILNKSALSIIGGLGVLTTALIFIFKDTILGLIAGFQLWTNNLISKGDWIEVPQFNADGDVIDVALHVIKVQNFDKTIVTVPTYKLIEGGFRNWRGMYDSGTRRIKRSLIIDQTTVHFFEQDKYKSMLDLITKQPSFDKKSMKAIPPFTNLTLFRTYVENYLKSHSEISNKATLLVRLLEPTPKGIPLQIYTFTTTTVWGDYERIQSSIFEHLIATLERFELKIYQEPTGLDLKKGLISR